jgi:hypothetical protein
LYVTRWSQVRTARAAPKGRQGAKRLHVHLLQGVVHAIAVAEQAKSERTEPPVVVVNERREGVRISPPGALENRRLDVVRR